MSSFFDQLGDKIGAMGSAFKQQTSGGSGGSGNSANSRCNDCRTQFPSLFPKKQRCAVCRYYFCRACVVSIPVNGRVQLGSPLPLRDAISSSVALACSRCRVLSNPNFTYEQLMGLRVRDLFWYLQRTGTHNDELRGLKEKGQLADLVMERFGNEEYKRERASDRQRMHERVARMATNMEQLSGASGQQQQQQRTEAPVPQSEVQPDTDAPETAAPETAAPETAAPEAAPHTQPQPAIPTVPPPPYPGLPDAADIADATDADVDTAAVVATDNEEEDNDIEIAQDAAAEAAASEILATLEAAEVAAAEEEAEAATTAAAAAAASSTPPHSSCPPAVTTIDQVVNESDLERLSVREMKQLLTRNFVDYRGCLERAELLERLRRLYREHAESREAVMRDELADSDLCKICMDAAVDCVLLECGHMVTCVTCGKQCADCPVCRQYVVRVVRTFKS